VVLNLKDALRVPSQSIRQSKNLLYLSIIELIIIEPKSNPILTKKIFELKTKV